MIDSHELNSMSASGAMQRDAMLRELLADMRQVHQHRRARRKIILVAIPVLIVALTSFFAIYMSKHQSPSGPLAFTNQPRHSDNIAKPDEHFGGGNPSAIVVQIITDPSIVDRWRATETPTATLIDDDGLLDAMREINRPTGLIHIDGRTLLTRDVTDEPLKNKPTIENSPSESS